MKLDASVTFESMTQAPRTAKVTVEGVSLPACARRAALAAKSQFKGAQWSSVVILLQKPHSDAEAQP